MSLTRSEPMRRAPLRSRSDRKRRTDAERTALLAEYRREGRDGCEIVSWLYLARRSAGGSAPDHVKIAVLTYAIRGCRGVMEGLHERRKRSSVGSLTNRQNLIPACNSCNGWVEDHPSLAHTIGLVVRSGDPEWEELAA